MRTKKETGSDKTFKVGYQEIIQSVLSAQRQLQRENEEKDFIVKAAVRNGLLAYSCNSKGEFKPIKEQEWYSADEYPMGTKRIPSDWLQNRYKWLDEETKVPIRPDFSLMQHASQVQDLIEWSSVPANQPKIEGEPEEPQDQLDIPEDFEFQDELIMPLNNSLFLSLSPTLRRAAMRRMHADQSFASILEKAAEAKKDKEKKQLVKNAARRFLSKKLLSSMSKREALVQIKARSTTKKNLGKKVLKAPMSFKKKVKLNLKKKAAQKLMSKKSLKALLEPHEAPPLAPKTAASEPAALAAAEAQEHELIGKQVRLVSEEVGKKHYGASGPVTSVSGGSATILTDKGAVHASLAHITELDPTWKPPAKFLAGNKVTRAALQQILEMSTKCYPQAFVEQMEDEIMLMPLAESGFLEDQQIMACWGWMKWQLKIPDDIFFMEPSLPYRLGLKEGSATMEGAREEILQVTKGMRQVLVPCQGQNPDHWTLLVANRAEDGKFRFRYYETLEVMHKDCLEAAKRLATVLNEDQEPAVFRENTIRQKGADCGFYVVAYSEQAASESKQGPAPRGWPEQIKAAWENRISFIMKVLKQEHEKLMQAKKHVEKLEKERKDKKQAKIKELQDKLKKMKDITTAAAISAQALLDKNSQYFQASMLSSEAKHCIFLAHHASTGCSRCRYSAGCLSCDGQKALAYFMRKEANSKDKVPKFEGPGAKEWGLLLLLLFCVCVVCVCLELRIRFGSS